MGQLKKKNTAQEEESFTPLGEDAENMNQLVRQVAYLNTR